MEIRGSFYQCTESCFEITSQSCCQSFGHETLHQDPDICLQLWFPELSHPFKNIWVRFSNSDSPENKSSNFTLCNDRFSDLILNKIVTCSCMYPTTKIGVNGNKQKLHWILVFTLIHSKCQPSWKFWSFMLKTYSFRRRLRALLDNNKHPQELGLPSADPTTASLMV